MVAVEFVRVILFRPFSTPLRFREAPQELFLITSRLGLRLCKHCHIVQRIVNESTNLGIALQRIQTRERRGTKVSLPANEVTYRCRRSPPNCQSRIAKSRRALNLSPLWLRIVQGEAQQRDRRGFF